MDETPQDDDQGKVEALVYFVVSPDEGPGHRIFEDENVVASGGVHAADMYALRPSSCRVQGMNQNEAEEVALPNILLPSESEEEQERLDQEEAEQKQRESP